MLLKIPKSKPKDFRGGFATLTDNCAFQEFGLTHWEMTKAEKRVIAEI